MSNTKEKKIFGIEKKIVCSIAAMVLLCSILIGGIGAYLNYTSSISALSMTMNEMSSLAAARVESELAEYVAIAYETGSIARLADPERALEDKETILQQRIDDHNFERGTIVWKDGKDMFDGTDKSGEEYFKQSMQGNNYIGVPKLNEENGKVETVISAPLWENGLPHTTPIGAVVYIPNSEFLNDIMRSITVGKSGTAFMVDDKANTIAHVNSESAGHENIIEIAKTNPKLEGLAKIEAEMITLKDGFGFYTYNGVSKIASYSPVPNSGGWSIAVMAIKNEFMVEFFISLIITVILVIVFSIVGIIIGLLVGRKIARPMTLCVERLQLLEQGDLSAEIPKATTKDETASLLAALETTITNLKMVVDDIGRELGELSEGNFTIKIDKTYKGNFGSVSESLRNIVASLNGAMGEIDGNANQVSRGSDDVARASQSLAEGATDQASSIEELTATITDISNKIQRNAEQSEEAQDTVLTMYNEIKQSNVHMNQMTDAMKKIKSASNEIADIIMTIEGIATQTNLLSLNAAIEAARAGEAGKGFAVVADQVRKLAEQSAEAAKGTTALIQNAIHAVEEGEKLTETTAESLKVVVENADMVNDAIKEISRSSAEQATATEQITEAVNQIAAVVEENSATAEESSAASEELSGQATMLKELLSKFKYN